MDYNFWFLSIFVFVFGLCIGSFLNCFIYRLEQKKKITGRSFCPHCKHTLKWIDLIPVLSFLFLKGKCRYCKKKISIQYPLVELATGVIFILIFNFLIFNFVNNFLILEFLNLAFWFYIASSLIIIFIYDLKHYIIPDKILFPAIIITFLYQLFTNFNLIINFLIAVVIASGFFLTIFLISKGKWMGFGDVKLAVLMGLLLGVQNVLVALFLAFFLGSVISIMLIIFNKKRLKSEIPFGPFLIAGTFLAMFWGQQLVLWYLNMFI
jgi:prepilin signal peptidase PulO-like enzyme (type II secretory pathway)